MRKTFILSTALLLLAAPVFAQDQNSLSPEGTWVDAEGTSFTFSLCGDDGTALCGVLNDIGGESRTEENLAFVNQEVVQAQWTEPNKWEGTINYGGTDAAATVALVAENAIEITGCQALILCESITFYKS